MSNRNKDQSPATTSSAVANFLDKVRSAPLPVKSGVKGRLVFALDATASREPTWDHACQLQGEMFRVTDSLGGLDIQLCYYRGFNEFHAGQWCDKPGQLLSDMSKTRCLGGHTQIAKVLEHLMVEHRKQPIQTAVFVGDAMEENPDTLCQLAGKLGVLGIPLFVFQEGYDAMTTSIFRQMANLSGGAYAPFNLASAEELKNLLSAVAVYAAGGHRALQDLRKRSSPEVTRLIQQLKE